MLVAVLAASGCASTPDDEATRPTVTTTVTQAPEPRPTPIAPVSHPPSTTAVAWAQGSRLHVGDRVADLGPMSVDAFAVTRGGVFVLSRGRLWLTDLVEVHDTGYSRVRSLSVSPDGRYLGFVDLPSFVREPHAVAVATVYDTSTGTPVLASTVGMGDAAEDDLPDLYEDAEPEPLGFLDDARFVARTPGGIYAYSLHRGRPRRLSSDLVSTSTQAGTTVGRDKVVGPERRYGLDDPRFLRFRPYDVATGAAVAVRNGPRAFQAGVWSSATQLDGVVLSRSVGGHPLSIVRCDLAAARCRTVVTGDRLGPGRVTLPTGAVEQG